MSVYEGFTYKQLQVVLSQNPNDLEARKKSDLFEKEALASEDRHFYFGPIFIVFILLFSLFGSLSSHMAFLSILFGFSCILRTIDNFLLKRELTKKINLT